MFYLGNWNVSDVPNPSGRCFDVPALSSRVCQASGDYIGMAIRQNHLVCVYKLGTEFHEVRTSLKLTPTSVNSSNFDRVVFHRYGVKRNLCLKVSSSKY